MFKSCPKHNKQCSHKRGESTWNVLQHLKEWGAWRPRWWSLTHTCEISMPNRRAIYNVVGGLHLGFRLLQGICTTHHFHPSIIKNYSEHTTRTISAVSSISNVLRMFNTLLSWGWRGPKHCSSGSILGDGKKITLSCTKCSNQLYTSTLATLVLSAAAIAPWGKIRRDYLLGSSITYVDWQQQVGSLWAGRQEMVE